jgi:hypothetical protein
MKKPYSATLVILFTFVVGCAPVPPIPNGPWAGQTTENRKNISIMNAETVANGMDAVRCGNNFAGKVVVADVSGHTRATVDTDPTADLSPQQRARLNRYSRDGNRPINRFESDHESDVMIVCN